MLATLIQQWTRRYIRLTEPVGFAHKQARMRQHIFNGVGNLHFLLVTDTVPTLLHISVFLFFAGLLILLRHINHTVFNAVVGWVALCVGIYAYITFLPIYRPDSPHFAPISSLAWQLYADVLYPFFVSPVKILNVGRPAARLLTRLEEKAEEIVLDKSPELDASILESLLVTLGEDSVREKFFEALPGFYDSQVVQVQDVNNNLSPSFFANFQSMVNQFVDQTLSSDSVSGLVKSRRLLACLKATQSVLGESAGTSITDKIIRTGDWNEIPPSLEIVDILRRWRISPCSSRALIGSCLIARIVAGVEKRDETWEALARSQLGVTGEVFRRYLEHGEDSVLLANLIKTTRLFFNEGHQFQGILRSISGFNVRETFPELQQEFCALWNEIVEKNKPSGEYIFILNEICHVHSALHSTAPTTVTALPTPTSAKNDGLPHGSSHALCTDAPPYHPRRPHLVPDTQSLPDPLTPLRGLPVEIRTHVPPALGYSYSSTTSYPPATPLDVSGSDAGVIVVASERDVQDLNPHNPHQSDPPALDISTSTSRPGKSDV